MNDRARRRGKLQLQFHFGLPPESEAIYHKLFQDLFKDLEIERLAVWELPGGSMGFSGLSMFLAKPFGSGDAEHNALVVRVGPKAIIAEERRRYKRYIEPLTGFDRPQSRLHASAGDLSAIDYDYLHHTDTDEPLQTLRDFLWKEQDVRTASQAVTVLMLETLARGPRRNRWYNDAHRFDRQQPLWFYNRVLPPTLQLEVLAADGAVEADAALPDVLAQADGPDGRSLHGRIIALKTSKQYPRLQIVDRKLEGNQARLRLHLFEHTPATSEQYSPLLPVAARLDLFGPAEILAALPDRLDRIVVYGRVHETRYAHFDRLYQQLSSVAQTYPDGRLRYASRLLANPIQRYHTLLSRPRALHTSIIHGDMNLGNILLSRTITNTTAVQMRAWLIDFEKTEPGGHTVFDAVKLETEYKLHILPHKLHSVDEFMLLEQILHQALIAPEEVAAVLAQHPALREPYHFIATLRRTVLCDLLVRIPPVEYYLGLLGYGLAALKYRNLFNAESWLSESPRVRPLAVAAYISASFAASAIDEIEGVTATTGSYPQIAGAPQPTFKLPDLVGREHVLSQARQRLRSTPSVVVVHGPPGSGRGAIAQTLCAELERSRACIWPHVPTAGLIRDPETLIAALVGMLREQGNTTLPTRLLSETHQLSIGQLHVHWASACNQLAVALDDSPQPIVVLLQLEQASAQLQAFITLLAQAVRRATLVIVVDYPLHDLDAHMQIAVPPLEQQHIETYVHTRQLQLDQAGIVHLHRASLGLPGLLLRLVNEARQYQDRCGSFQAAVMQLPISKHIDEFCDHVLQRFPPLVKQLIELAALVRENSPDVLEHVESLFRSMAVSLSRVESQEIDQAAREYRQLVQQDNDLLSLLTARALERMRARPDFRRIAGFVAQWLAEHALADHYAIAQYWALAKQWPAASETLARIVDEPSLMFSSRCQQLYDLTLLVLEHEQDHNEEELFELAGNCAAYLGSYKAAAAHYERVIAILPASDPCYARMSVQLLHVLEAAGEDTAALCQILLRQVKPTHPLYALCLAYQVTPDDASAAQTLETTIQLLEESRAQWNGDALFYEEQLVRLNDTLAYVAYLRGDFNTAIDIFTRIRVTAKHVLNNRALTARIDGLLGGLYMYRGQARDLIRARQSFKTVLKLRQELGDRVGQIYTAQNLAFLIQNQASSIEQWDEAEQHYTRYEDMAQQIDGAKAWLLAANHTELLIRRGHFQRAHALFERGLDDHRCDQDTLALLLLNQAKAALWECDTAQFQMCVARFQAATGNIEQRIEDRLEWLQLSLEAHLLLGTPLDATIAAHVLEVKVSPVDQPLIAAMWSFSRGLLALAENQLTMAIAMFADSQSLWGTAGFHYHTAIALLWNIQAQLQMQDYPQACLSIDQARRILEPFGETPALHRLHDLTCQLETPA
ncbi:MAG TPA: AAA family ATPase [Herpetosiphonaceae bacterium]